MKKNLLTLSSILGIIYGNSDCFATDTSCPSETSNPQTFVESILKNMGKFEKGKIVNLNGTEWYISQATGFSGASEVDFIQKIKTESTNIKSLGLNPYQRSCMIKFFTQSGAKWGSNGAIAYLEIQKACPSRIPTSDVTNAPILNELVLGSGSLPDKSHDIAINGNQYTVQSGEFKYTGNTPIINPPTLGPQITNDYLESLHLITTQSSNDNSKCVYGRKWGAGYEVTVVVKGK